MERKHVRNTLKQILEDETDTSIQDLPDETIVTEVFGLDSVDRVSLMMRSSWASRAGSSRTIRLSAEKCRGLSVWGCRHHIRSPSLSFRTQGWRERLPQ